MKLGFGTAVASAWQINIDHLSKFNMGKCQRSFRGDLYRCGAAQARGWLFGGFHSSYEPVSRTLTGHYHCVATEEMIGVFDDLRYLRKYEPTPNATVPIHVPVHLRENGISNLPYLLTYLIKAYIPCRRQKTDFAGKKVLSGFGDRIPEPWHSQVLCWLDRQSLKDLTLLIHLTVRDGYLRYSPPKSKTN